MFAKKGLEGKPFNLFGENSEEESSEAEEELEEEDTEEKKDPAGEQNISLENSKEAIPKYKLY